MALRYVRFCLSTIEHNVDGIFGSWVIAFLQASKTKRQKSQRNEKHASHRSHYKWPSDYYGDGWIQGH